MYCNLLQVSDFADTAIIAEMDEEMIGFVTGYRPPGRDHVLFVWQVAVAEKARGHRLGDQMLLHLVARQPGVTMMETTVTPDNIPSAKMFERFAKDKSAQIKRSVKFSRNQHFDGEHDDEVLFQIGPFDTTSEGQVCGD